MFRPHKSVRFVSSALAAKELRDIVKKHGLDANDSLIVIEVPANADWATGRNRMFLDSRMLAAPGA